MSHRRPFVFIVSGQKAISKSRPLRFRTRKPLATTFDLRKFLHQRVIFKNCGSIIESPNWKIYLISKKGQSNFFCTDLQTKVIRVIPKNKITISSQTNNKVARGAVIRVAALNFSLLTAKMQIQLLCACITKDVIFPTIEHRDNDSESSHKKLAFPPPFLRPRVS